MNLSNSRVFRMTDGQSASLSWNKAPIRGLTTKLLLVRQLRVCWCGALSLTRGRECRLQFLLALASAVILGSEPRGNRYHIFLPQIPDFPFCRLLRLAGLRWKYSLCTDLVHTSETFYNFGMTEQWPPHWTLWVLVSDILCSRNAWSQELIFVETLFVDYL
jgi:hypothetical protein